MDDPQRQPKDSDRAALVARINSAGADGRISQADRDIRLGNVRSATSVSELDLMSRELDQLDAALPPKQDAPAGTVEDKPWSKFQPVAKGDDDDDDAGDDDVSDIATAAIPTRVVGILVSVVVAIAIVVAGVVWVGYSAGQKDTPDGPDPSGQTGQDPGGSGPDPGGSDPAPSGTKYALTADGITGFLKTYRKRFGTSRVVELTLYDDYAIVGVPVPGKARQEGWLYRGGNWTGFGGVRAVFPGSRIVNTNRLAVPALVHNIRRAKRSLNVEKAKAYVVVRFIRPVDDAPRVDVHVTNDFSESGYLATTMAGKVVRSYAYSAQ